MMNLTHHFLIAMPQLADAFFGRSVVYLCQHGKHGAMGLVINRPMPLNLEALLHQADLSLEREDLRLQPVLHGGPMLIDRGFVLHDPMRVVAAVQEGDEAYHSPYASTMPIVGGLEVTTSKDVLEALSFGGGPQRLLVTLGYSAWENGQLEAELADNNWLTVKADSAVLFDTPVGQRYERALALLGLQEWMLSREAGHA